MTAIPKIIFQTWKDRKNLPSSFKIWRQTILDRHPLYKHILWNDANNRRFMQYYFPWFMEIYDSYEQNIMRVDAVRYFFLYQFGGIYLDLDTECLKPLDSYLDAGDIVLGQMGFDETFTNCIPNAIMMSAPKQEFWLVVFYMLRERHKCEGRPEMKTGPALLKKSLDIYRDPEARSDVLAKIAGLSESMGLTGLPHQESNIVIVHPLEFYPVNWKDPIHQYFVRGRVVRNQEVFSESEKKIMFSNASLVTYWTHS